MALSVPKKKIAEPLDPVSVVYTIKTVKGHNAPTEDETMTAQQVHDKLKNDRAYIWSRENKDWHNMMIVLRAHGLKYSFEHAQIMINFEA